MNFAFVRFGSIWSQTRTTPTLFTYSNDRSLWQSYHFKPKTFCSITFRILLLSNTKDGKGNTQMIAPSIEYWNHIDNNKMWVINTIHFAHKNSNSKKVEAKKSTPNFAFFGRFRYLQNNHFIFPFVTTRKKNHTQNVFKTFSSVVRFIWIVFFPRPKVLNQHTKEQITFFCLFLMHRLFCLFMWSSTIDG